MNNPMAQEYKKRHFWKQFVLAFRRFWQKEPRLSEIILAEMCHRYLYRRTRRMHRKRRKTIHTLPGKNVTETVDCRL